jgi:allantoin racemase
MDAEPSRKIGRAEPQHHIGSLDPGCQRRKSGRMARILVINPNSSEACSAGISRALTPFRFAGGPFLDVATLKEGPPAIYSWRDWHAVVDPMCRLVERSDADVYVIACASDPGLEAVRTVTPRPVLGIFRSAVAAAVARAERFGVIALVEASKARHRLGLRAMGLEDRLAGEVALNVSMEALLDPDLARAALVAAGRELKTMGAETLILGCTGMAHHAPAIRDAVGLPVIEPAQAAAALAVGMLLAEGR